MLKVLRGKPEAYNLWVMIYSHNKRFRTATTLNKNYKCILEVIELVLVQSYGETYSRNHQLLYKSNKGNFW